MTDITINISDELGRFLGIYEHFSLAPNIGDEILHKGYLYNVVKRRFYPNYHELNIIVDSSTKKKIEYEYTPKP